MAYSTPLTAVSSTALTAAQWNASVRDNILVTPAALATAAGQIFVATGTNAIAARVPSGASVNTSELSASTSYADIPAGTVGPAVTVTTGAMALVGVAAKMQNNTNSVNSKSSYAVSGATTVAASDNTAVDMQFAAAATTTLAASRVTLHTGLTPGSNTFTMKYRVTAGTGTFDLRHIFVIPF